jgi:hypothetical protein
MQLKLAMYPYLYGKPRFSFTILAAVAFILIGSGVFTLLISRFGASSNPAAIVNPDSAGAVGACAGQKLRRGKPQSQRSVEEASIVCDKPAPGPPWRKTTGFSSELPRCLVEFMKRRNLQTSSIEGLNLSPHSGRMIVAQQFTAGLTSEKTLRFFSYPLS